ncbi:hypothetical protein ACFO4E_05975 [Nocardiopsis mangrovi]|uniref:Uncharacterized protein n=1 Tax=Nocardiopsis mangrovi TaxID=1179818 RepID=A0ABV9DRS5_9ACTN
MEHLGAILLLALGGLLAGGAYSFWTGAGAADQGAERGRTRTGRYIAAGLALCAVLSAAGGVLRLGYLPL